MGNISLELLAVDFADALKRVDSDQGIHKNFSPGIGPFGETEMVRAGLTKLKLWKPECYAASVIKRLPDLLIPGEWALEFKIARPFGDNGRPAEHWSENLLHPYAGNTSSLGDCIKLLSSDIPERKGIIILGYEHTPPKISLEPAISPFEMLAGTLLGICLTPRVEQLRDELVHCVHQQLRLFAYEVQGPIRRQQ